MATVLPREEEWTALAPGPGSPVARAFSDARMLMTAGYALLLQVAHPTVGHGVHDHSGFVEDPWGRLLRTLDYVHGTIAGGPRMAGEIGARVRAMHRDIRGTLPDGRRYAAMEPDAFAWVHLTLALAVVDGHRAFARPMSPAELDAFWAGWRDVGRLVGVRDRDLPVRWPAARELADATIRDELVLTPAVPQVLATIGAAKPPHPALPEPVWRVAAWPAGAHLQAVTIGLLPPVLRERLGLELTPGRAAAFRATTRAARSAGPLMRGPLGDFSASWVRWRRAALARGDVAAAMA